ncbi:hypothetical protein ACKFRM_02205 [Corynebacterium sp. YSMAA1_1_D6]|uniref:hypothetical protein n=1 Tax=Corynebacterium sp. YSMAA1_1_D6 TaxID=3383589 RepID=UPI0025F2253A|nr:hypothetical protein [uncultured Corynebacterium sp.]
MASDVTFPLLDPADAQRMLDYARSQESGLTLPTSESAHIDSQIERVINDDVFIGSIEDAAPAAHYLEAREILRETAGTIDNVDDSLTIASLGAITGQPQLVGHGYSRIALAWLNIGDREKAEQFAAKAADAGDSRVQQALAAAKEKEEQEARERAEAEKAAQAARAAQAEKEARAAKEAKAAQAAHAPGAAHTSSQNSTSAESLSQLRSRLESATTASNPKVHAKDFVAINNAATTGDFKGEGASREDILSVILNSAVGALWASESDADRTKVAKQSFNILSQARREDAYKSLPARMLARFYFDAGANSQNDHKQREACFRAAAKEYARSGDLDGELESLLQTILLEVRHRDPDEAYDILASRYVDSMKLSSLPTSARWTVLYSESLRIQTGNLFESTQVLLNFLEKHPLEEASLPDEQSALAEVAELLGDRYTSANAHQRARNMYKLAYNLFASAGNTQALEKLSKKA